MRLSFIGAGAVLLVAAPATWFLGLLGGEALLVRFCLGVASRRALWRFACIASLIAALFYGQLGPEAGGVVLGPLRLSGQDFATGLLAGARLASLLALFALGARLLPAGDLLPYVSRGGIPAYLAGGLLRAVPTIRADAERLREAQTVRGHRFAAGPWAARSWLPFVVPVFVASLRRAREQAIALHLAGVIQSGSEERDGTRAHRWAMVAALAALAIAGRLALVAWPGVSLSFFVVFIAGVAFGPLAGLLVGLVERVATDLALSGFHPILLTMAPVEASLGFASGLAGRAINFGQRGRQPAAYAAALAAWAGAGMTLVFSVAADSLNWLVARMFLPQVSPDAMGAAWMALVVGGLVFNIPSLIFNAALFAAAAPATLQALRRGGLLPVRAHRAQAH